MTLTGSFAKGTSEIWALITQTESSIRHAHSTFPLLISVHLSINKKVAVCLHLNWWLGLDTLDQVVWRVEAQSATPHCSQLPDKPKLIWYLVSLGYLAGMRAVRYKIVGTQTI